MILMTLALALSASAQVRLPDMGDPAGATISVAEERELGGHFMRELRASVTIVDDPEVEEYISSLGHRLAAQAEQQQYAFDFFVVAADSINAFAGPGGYIGAHSGLILASESESELAAVMAHEIAHVTQRHIARSIELGDRSRLAALAGILAAIAVGTQNPEAGQAVGAAVIGSQIQRALNFSRANEQEADRVGMQFLHEAGFDPRAMPVFFERLQTASRFYGRPPEYLSTHPVTTSRIADTRGRAERYPYRQYADSLSFFLVQAKLRVLTARDPKTVRDHFERVIDAGQHRSLTGAAYGYALALDRAGESEAALEVLRKLLEEHPDRLSFRVALADIEIGMGKVNQALRVYREAHALFPDNAGLVRGYARAMLQLGQHGPARQLIGDYARMHGLDAALYRLQAEALKQAGDDFGSHLALAEHLYLNGQVDAALQQLEFASRLPEQDFYRTSRLDARMQELQDLRAARLQRR